MNQPDSPYPCLLLPHLTGSYLGHVLKQTDAVVFIEKHNTVTLLNWAMLRIF